MTKLLVFIGNGTEEVEALTVVDYARRAGIEVSLASVEEGRKIKGAHNIFIGADILVDEIVENDFDGLYIPGGLPGADHIRDSKRAIEIIKEGFSKGKIIAAICAAPIVLEKALVLEGKNYTCYPGFEEKIKIGTYVDENIVVDKNLITGKGPAIAGLMAFEIIKALKGQEASEKIKEETLYNLL